MTTDALVIENVTKRYQAAKDQTFTAVDNLNLRVHRGETLGFLGPNGAGKTTTIRMIMSILYPDEGRISLLGHDDTDLAKDNIGYLPEERGLYRKMTCEQTLRYFGHLKGLRGPTLRERVDEALDRVSLQDWRRKKVEALSKGMQQKLQFVMTIMHRPELVILDEPFSGLDPLNVDLLKRLILDLRKAGVTVLFSTHQMEQAQRMCDRLVLINRGRKVVEGTMNEIRDRFTSRVLELDGDGDFSDLRQLDDVATIEQTAGHARLELTEHGDAQVVMNAALSLGFPLSRLELVRPDLQEIFVQLVGGDVPDDFGRESDDLSEAPRASLEGVAS